MESRAELKVPLYSAEPELKNTALAYIGKTIKSLPEDFPAWCLDEQSSYREDTWEPKPSLRPSGVRPTPSTSCRPRWRQRDRHP